MPPATPSNPPRHLASLDGLRGFAVLLVVFSHASNVRMFLHPWLDLRGTGRIGVFLFFVISSFLLTRIALGAQPQDLARPAYWGSYAKRRVARVMPAYLVVLGLYVVAQGWSPLRALQHAGLLRGEGHFWTVPVEMRWYLLLPVAVGVLAVARWFPVRGSSLLGAGVLLALAYGLRSAYPPDYAGLPPAYAPPLLTFVPVFLAGCVAAVLEDAWRASDWRATRAGRAAWEMVGWAGLAGFVLHFPAVRQWLSGQPVEFTRYHLLFDLFALCSVALVLGTLLGTGYLKWIFERLALRFVGWVSFSLYLVHKLVLDGVIRVGRSWPDPLPMIALLATSLAMAWLLWRWVERPCMRAVRRGEREASS